MELNIEIKPFYSFNYMLPLDSEGFMKIIKVNAIRIFIHLHKLT